MPSQAELEDLRAVLKDTASARVWSQGVTLAREQRVAGKASNATEATLEVRVPGRPTPFTVVLYPRDQEWDCDCGSREAACSHAVAATLAAIEAAGRGQELPTSTRAGASISYRLTPDPAGLRVQRVAVWPGGREEVIDASVSSIVAGRIPGPRLATTDVDLMVDQMIGTRLDGAFSGDRVDRLLAVLADAPDVRLGGAKVTTSGEPVLPRAVLDDDPAGGVELRLEAPVGAAAIALGVARVGDTVRPIGASDLAGGRMERLPSVRHFPAADLPSVVTRVLPDLAARLPVEVKTARLPSVSHGETPRIALDVLQKGETLSVMATLVYGDPPRARVDGDRLVHLSGAVPVRDLAAEQHLRLRLRDQLDLLPGRRVEATGPDAHALSNKLARWLRDDARGAEAARTWPLEVEIDLQHGLQLRFAAGGKTAPAEAVLRAWQARAELVALEGGGWGRVPMAWLDEHGALLSDLLTARGEQGALPPYALPDAKRLADDLGLAAPDLRKIAPLVADFTGIPAAGLPADLTAELRSYQKAGVDWLAFCRDAGMGCVLADDMGLGKTVQTLCAMRGRTLVVCPTSVAPNWQAEARRFRPGLRVALYHGARRSLDEEADITITTYPLLRNDIDALSAIAWDTVVLDEAQAIKNPDSQIARAAYKLRGAWRVSLSGTPIENRLDELWSQLNFVNPGLLGLRRDFATRWEQPIVAGDRDTLERLRARIKPFVLRRKKVDVEPELPPRTEDILWVELDERERAAYDAIRAATQAEVVALLAQGGGVMAALEALLRLRQAACHRGLLPGQSADGSTKLTTLLEALTEAAAEGHKALVFSQWTSLLDRVEPALAEAGLAWTRLDGSTKDRGAVVAGFQDEGGPPVMLLSLKAGGTGLNLTAADHVFLLDPWWNPAAEDQAADRAHRIGQDKPVNIYRLVARDTVEERVLELQARKRALAAAALDGAAAAASITREDLLALLS
ncbi:MAG TPA: DEAD/DEAH box helicase [Kofleriaceae bacterium]|nr:DEAD/DEAH box helicase [Kofleriaceae bacterium]